MGITFQKTEKFNPFMYYGDYLLCSNIKKVIRWKEKDASLVYALCFL